MGRVIVGRVNGYHPELSPEHQFLSYDLLCIINNETI